MFRWRTAIHAVIALMLGVAGALVATQPASAGSAKGCPYPYVCFYDGYPGSGSWRIDGKFKVVTSSPQWITGSTVYSTYVYKRVTTTRRSSTSSTDKPVV